MRDPYYAEAAARHMKRPILESICAEIDKDHRTLLALLDGPQQCSRDMQEVKVLRELAQNLELRVMCVKAQAGAKCPAS